MCRPTKPLVGIKSRGRSVVSNGKQLHANAVPVDGRSHHARRFRDIIQSYVDEIGGTLTESEMGLIRQAAALALRCEQLQAAIARGEQIDDDLLVRISGTAKRLLGAIGSKGADRKPGAPNLADWLAERNAAQSSDDTDDED
jgi:hypothetical protein